MNNSSQMCCVNIARIARISIGEFSHGKRSAHGRTLLYTVRLFFQFSELFCGNRELCKSAMQAHDGF